MLSANLLAIASPELHNKIKVSLSNSLDASAHMETDQSSHQVYGKTYVAANGSGKVNFMVGGSIGVMLLAVIFIGSTTSVTSSNKCHASSNRCLTSSNKEAIKIKFKVACAFFWPFL